jgi:CelD/BcsL family acetyltransferase involved in cellulose biosynthesis
MKPGLRLFVAGHLVAIGAIYGTAVAVGGQWVDGLLPVPQRTQSAMAFAAAAPARDLAAALAADRRVVPSARSDPDWLQAAQARDLRPPQSIDIPLKAGTNRP